MYRQGLGDCFLLGFPKKDATMFWIMIDCGVVLGTPDPETQMRKVVEHIIATTGGVVDVLVATHEHWDHVSGFAQVKDLFSEGGRAAPGKLAVKALWLAWTEDSRNALANKLRADRRSKEQALRAAAQEMRRAEHAMVNPGWSGALPDSSFHIDSTQPSGNGSPFSMASQIDELVSLFGARGATTSDALANARQFSATPPSFHTPGGKPIEIEGVPGLKVFVLGPPQDEKMLKKSDPSRKNPETYEASMADSEFGIFAAVDGSGEDYEAGRESTLPFDAAYRLSYPQAQQMPFFERYYWGPSNELPRNQSWRRIDSAWLGGAERFALQLDSDTNNTSLVLAFELDGGDVLLFPGDAQVGNWLSWQDLTWTDNGRTVTADELLSRTILYKVGHHGSHNATLREHGLEKMTRDNLVAMIPVDHAMAVKKRWGKMPFDPLVKRLKELTQGRILRVDEDAPKELTGRVPKTDDIVYEYVIE
jgi:hypothetical protein